MAAAPLEKLGRNGTELKMNKLIRTFHTFNFCTIRFHHKLLGLLIFKEVVSGHVWFYILLSMIV